MTAPVKRYNMDVQSEKVRPYESEHGRWVKRDDYERLEQECKKLRQDAKRWNKLKAHVMGGSMGLPEGYILADESEDWDEIVDGLPELQDKQ